MSVAAAVAALLAVAAGCTAGERADRTGPTPPDRLTLTAEGGAGSRLRVELDCAVADREACAGVVAALVAAEDQGTCSPADGGDRELHVAGTLDGREVRAVLARRTDCEIAAYDAAAAAAGL